MLKIQINILIIAMILTLLSKSKSFISKSTVNYFRNSNNNIYLSATSIPRIKIKKILESSSIVGAEVSIKGWVKTVRDQKKFAFIQVNDGSTLSGIQAVADASIESYSEVNRYYFYMIYFTLNLSV